MLWEKDLAVAELGWNQPLRHVPELGLVRSSGFGEQRSVGLSALYHGVRGRTGGTNTG